MERTDQEPEQPTPVQQPQPNSIIREPATVEACQADYAAGAEIRREMARQEARRRR
ncbi:hypothetical protein [Streptomyces olivaceus]|uniref:hypothetical protein n=1 Tax=Streptomyces olivaceus TaxID=47716 RepID=UPI0022EECEF4|nr:hypothetical protein [Streptomyces olivaceus]GHI91297.1 hypothetical protein TPA0905_07680 [Streptomyces olivaceus]